MTASIYTELFGLRDVGGDMIERIKALSVYDVFEPLATKYAKEPAVFNGLLFYILDAYSTESKSVVIDADWLSIKQRLFKKHELPAHLERGVVLLQMPEFAQVVRAYVDYQQSETYRHYCMLRDLYTQMLDIALMQTDVDDKYKAQGHAKNLLNEIEFFKSKLKVDFQLLSPDEAALPKKAKVSSKIEEISLDIEDYATGKDGAA